MNGKIPRSDWLIIAVIGLLVQSIWLVSIDQPSYMDAYYYATNGQRIADGYGFSEMVIWQYLDNPEGLPSPSHTYWMPFPSLLAALGHIIRPDFLGEQLLFWLFGGLLPLISFLISLMLSGERWQAWVAALLAATGSFYGAFFSQPTTFTPFAWFGSACLLTLGLAGMSLLNGDGGRIIRWASGRRRWLLWLLAGLFTGLAHLTRADGLLLLVIALACLVSEILIMKKAPGDRRGVRHGQNSIIPTALLHFVSLIGGYLLVMGWWFIRNLLVINRPLSTVGFQSIFLTTYDDLFAYGRVIDLGSYLEWGWANIIGSKVESLWIALQTMLVVPGLIFLTPFIVIALVKLYRLPAKKALLRPMIWYTILLFLVMSLIFTFPGMRGALFHSSSALWPWTTALAAAGIGFAVDMAAARLSHWQPERAKKRFSLIFIALALIVGLYVSQIRAMPPKDPEIMREIDLALPSGSIVMAGNAPAVYYHMDLPAISVPNEPLEVALQVANKYGATHMLLDENTPVPLKSFYEGETIDRRVPLIASFEDVKLYKLPVLAEGTS